jgi:hypothetical protein
VVELTDELDECGLLVGEVDVEGSLGDPGSANDLGDRGAIVGELAEDVFGCIEDRLPRGAALLGRRFVQGRSPPSRVARPNGN